MTSRLENGLRRLFPASPGSLDAIGADRLLPRAMVLAVLLSSAWLEDAIGHAHSHWLVLAGYLAATAVVVIGPGRAQTAAPWIVTVLDALLAIYVLVEHLLVREPAVAGETVSQLPAFLLLLQTGLGLRLDRTVAFATIVVIAWSACIGLAAAGLSPSSTRIGHLIFGLASFLTAGAFTLAGVARIRSALADAVVAEREKAFLARFVPPGTALDLVGSDGRADVRPRHAALLSVDIRGFSELSRRHDRRDVLRWLLQVRSLVNDVVTAENGVVDKYVGDGVLAQFFSGPPARQAGHALAAALTIKERLDTLNDSRAKVGLPPLRVVLALHTGEVLAGILDDGRRAELTVLGPAMNALSRIERRAKQEGFGVLASKRFARLIEPSLTQRLILRRLKRRQDELDTPDLVLVSPKERSPAQVASMALRVDAFDGRDGDVPGREPKIERGARSTDAIDGATYRETAI